MNVKSCLECSAPVSSRKAVTCSRRCAGIRRERGRGSVPSVDEVMGRIRKYIRECANDAEVPTHAQLAAELGLTHSYVSVLVSRVRRGVIPSQKYVCDCDSNGPCIQHIDSWRQSEHPNAPANCLKCGAFVAQPRTGQRREYCQNSCRPSANKPAEAHAE